MHANASGDTSLAAARHYYRKREMRVTGLATGLPFMRRDTGRPPSRIPASRRVHDGDLQSARYRSEDIRRRRSCGYPFNALRLSANLQAACAAAAAARRRLQFDPSCACSGTFSYCNPAEL